MWLYIGKGTLFFFKKQSLMTNFRIKQRAADLEYIGHTASIPRYTRSEI